MSRLALSVALLTLGACAEAQAPRSTAPPGATAPAPAEEASEGSTPVCHEEAVTGSNMTRTVCRTKSQEELDRDQAKEFGEKSSRRRQTLK